MRFWVQWWVLSMALWLLLTSTVVVSEVLTGAAVAVLAASVATVARHQEDATAAPRQGWLDAAATLPWRVVRDTWLVGVHLVRCLTGPDRGGRLSEQRLPATTDAAERRSLEGLLTVAISTSPNSIVVGFDDERGVMFVHELVQGPTGPGGASGS